MILSMLFYQWKLAEICQRLEHDLEILGVSAIEDRLQVHLVASFVI